MKNHIRNGPSLNLLRVQLIDDFFVNLMSNLALLSNNSHTFLTSANKLLFFVFVPLDARAPTAKVVFKFEIKSLSLAMIQTHDLHGTKLVRYQLSYPAWVLFRKCFF